MRRALLALLLPAIAACQAEAARARADLQVEAPALLVQPDAPARQELRAAVAQMLKLPSVLLADDALTRDNLLVIEKVRPRDARGLPLGGRDFDKPEQFRLFMVDGACVLVRQRTGARTALRAARCAAAAQATAPRPAS
jgi:hypothetical protein